MFVLTQNHGADKVALQVHGEAVGVARELEHFALHHVCQTVDTNDTVGHGNYRTLGTDFSAFSQVLNLGLDQIADFRGVQLHDLS